MRGWLFVIGVGCGNAPNVAPPPSPASPPASDVLTVRAFIDRTAGRTEWDGRLVRVQGRLELALSTTGDVAWLSDGATGPSVECQLDGTEWRDISPDATVTVACTVRFRNHQYAGPPKLEAELDHCLLASPR